MCTSTRGHLRPGWCLCVRGGTGHSSDEGLVWHCSFLSQLWDQKGGGWAGAGSGGLVGIGTIQR